MHNTSNKSPSKKNSITIYEFDHLTAESNTHKIQTIPFEVYSWLESKCRACAEDETAQWLKLTQSRKGGHKTIQLTNYVGVIRSPSGYQIEVLPKIGRNTDEVKTRKLLISMLSCLHGFRHVQTDHALLAASKMKLLEVFIGEFLRSVGDVIKRGLRSDYVARQDNLFVLRGKLIVSQHLRQNLHRADRFFTEHDEFLTNRPENRLIHSALRRVLSISSELENQRLAREFCCFFSDIPESAHISQDFKQVHLNRGMSYYADALAWTKLILDDQSPLTGEDKHQAPSLLFPMEAVFEAFVAKHLAKQLKRPYVLKAQSKSYSLVEHKEKEWFQLKPDLLVKDDDNDVLVLDTKWKLIDQELSNGTDKYGLSQSDFYQLYAYGHSYLGGQGDVILIYPATEKFKHPLEVFKFPKHNNLQLWVLPFCIECRKLLTPKAAPFQKLWTNGHSSSAVERTQPITKKCCTLAHND